MIAFIDKIFIYLTVAFALFLPLGIFIYYRREKVAASVKHNAKTNIKIIVLYKKAVSILRLLLWISPFYLILVPWAFSKYLDVNGIIVFACMVLMFANVLVEYLYLKWISQYLSKPDPAK